ncbi:biotin carboxylase N-terminal domain-containing protein [Dactylosporangium sucinum]|uniref:Acetyl/propionyl-CoA carboxylase subuit alpha n=1 Tax=Dactylosporangium sucinum TaxID=1424081 RepID=A0A917TRH8_9ACTN|nr:biotin carboxylase N-terminal domain-containing protein [Dactylosporangium sucinum]GGM33608.1 acetyl/propionyl-CoA carboxylase subuit alpha [Dactylosporangium sucinum]
MIRRLLVANRGEIARRVFATCRSMGIETVAVYSDADADSPHVGEADYAVHLPGSAPNATYLRGDLLIAAARKCGADAVHPGYGFLSENADFARAVIDAGLTWVGPSPKAIAMMGSKLEAKQLLADVGVPMLPTAVEPEQVDTFPVLVKASAGGGGRGMRVVRDREALAEAVAAARREAASAFGDGTVFCERYIERARHIEVQIMADSHGNVVPLGERECSIQRRHQKIVEETPSPAVDATLREKLCQAAIAAARAVSYVGAGTVEFLLAPSGEFFFLEMNTRLQVEHPVTECVIGVDIVRLQLHVAEGGTLPFNGSPPLRGHAIEVRLYAEDPAYAWMPSTGTLHRFDVPGAGHAFGPLTAPGLRLDSGVTDGSVIGVHYDPMLAKLIAWAPTRAEAARMLSNALARARIHGVTTNRDLLVRVLRHSAFLSGGTDTGFLDRHPEVFAPLLSSVDAVRLSCLAVALAGAARRGKSAALPGLPSGWRNVPSALQTVVYEGPTGTIEVGYRLDRSNDLAAWAVRRIDPEDIGLPGAALDPTGAPDHPPAAILSATGERVVLDVAGVRLQFAVHEVDGVSFVDSPEGSMTLTELPRYPLPVAEQPEGSLVAPLPGAVGRVLVVPGQRVAAGELLLTVEAMKLEHPVHAPTDGVISDLRVAAGSQVESGALLAVLTPS